MKKILFLIVLAVAILFIWKHTETEAFKVVKIKDGDTLELLTPDYKTITVRLAGIDAPEKSQPYGNAAKQYLALRCFGKDVKLKGHELDRYGRTVATVLLTDDTNINYEMVRNGYAWEYLAYSKDPQLGRLQQYAKTNRLGLWQDENPMEPWNFRKSKTQKTHTTQPKAPKPKKPRKKKEKKTDDIPLASLIFEFNEIC